MIRTISTFGVGIWTVAVSGFRLKKFRKLQETLPVDEFDTRLHKEVIKPLADAVERAHGAHVTVVGAEHIPNETFLVVANHQSDFDIPLLVSHIDRPLGFVAKIEMEKIPLMSEWMRLMGCIFMDRSDRRQSLKSIIQGIRQLKEGRNLVIFPEGTRTRTGETGEFKPGALKLATGSEATVLPVTIDGSYFIYEGNNKRVKPADVVITIHPPITHDEYKELDTNEFTERVQTLITNAIRTK
ncbi:MAG: lysophospholipid acyltransferase family protein [Bacilli bacterium]